MLNKQYIFSLILFCFCVFSFAQEGTPESIEETEEASKVFKKKDKEKIVVIDSTDFTKQVKYDPLAPSRAAFYSAILPGLGQAYNKKYWKIPIVYGLLGTGVYFFIQNNDDYNRLRNAYKRRLAGFNDDEFQGRITDDNLRERQTSVRRNRDLSLLVTIGIYALNIIDANVDAHLLQYNINEDLSLKPHYKIDPLDNIGRVGLTLNFNID